MPYRKEDLSYIAGLVDGEGYIGLVKHNETRRQKHTRNITLFYRSAVKISMCDRTGIDFIKKVIGGKIWFKEFKDIKNKNQWTWQADSYSDARKVLELILPYLKVKKKQAEILLNFIKKRQMKNSHKTKWGQTSYDEIDDKTYSELRLLNKRGK